jgi:hypothetical protein
MPLHLDHPKPKVLRPIIKSPVGERFWEYCQTHQLLMNLAVTTAVQQWLDNQDSSENSTA